MQIALKRSTTEAAPARRGRSTVHLALVAVAIVVACIGAFSWWAARAERDTLEASRSDQVRTLAPLLGRTVEQMLNEGDLSGTRRMLMEAARDWKLSTCRVLLSEHQVLADRDPKKITVARLPDHWTAEPPHALADGQVWSYAFPIAKHGIARLELSAAPTLPPAWWDVQAGVGMIGVSTLAMLLLVYRRAASRVRPFWVLREALLAVAGGESDPQRLELDTRIGPEVQGWNRLLEEIQKLRQRTRSDALAETMTPKQRGGGDLDAAFDVMSNGLLLLDSRQKVRFANGAAAIYLRTERDTIVGRDVAEVIPEAPVLAVVREITSGSFHGNRTIEVNRQGETSAILRFGVRRMRKGDTSSAMIVIEDVTQQRVADAARNSFVAQVAHELRAPLTNIRLYVESAIEGGDDDPVQRSNALNVINQESRRLERTIGEMLSISEIEAGSMRIHKDDVRLDALLDEARVDFEAQAKEKRIELELALPPKLPILQADRDKLALAIHNLVGNAIKYTPEGGKVVVRAEQTPRDIRIDIADTGIGIRAEELERVFERFYRANDERVAKITGTGLGLALAREVARLHGGDVTAESQIGQGSTFTLTLPLPEAGKE